MTIITYEVDRTVVTVEVPSNAPVLAWSEGAVRKGNTRLEVSTSITPPRTVIATIPKDALSHGVWKLQVRAGATEAHAQTVFDDSISVRDSI